MNALSSDFEFVKKIGAIYNEVMKLRKDDDFVVNQPQMDKFIKVVEFFTDLAEKIGGKVEEVAVIPKEEHGGITATFIVFDIYGSWIPRFAEVVLCCSAISIDVVEGDKVCISCTIPEVFVPKKK